MENANRETREAIRLAMHVYDAALARVNGDEKRARLMLEAWLRGYNERGFEAVK